MAFVTADRVLDTSTSTGTGAIVVSGSAPNGYRTFSAVMSTSDTCYYSIQHETLNEWETGTATYSSANTLTRTTVSSSSNAGSAVNFSAGTKNVSLTFLSSKSLQTDPSGNVTPAFGGGTYTRTTFTATAGQTSFTASYTVGYVQVYVNGILLNSADYTATTGTTVVLASAAAAGDIVDVVALNIGTFTSGGYTRTTYTASAGQTSFTAAYTPNYVQVYANGVLLDPTDYTASSGTAIVLGTAATAGDTVDIVALNIGGFTGGVTVTGTPASGQLTSWTGSSSVQGFAPSAAGDVPFSTDGTTFAATQKIVRGTSQATTSGTAVGFTGIPSWVKRITLLLNEVSTNGTTGLMAQIGSGSYTTSGYSNGYTMFAPAAGTSAVGGTTTATGFAIGGLATTASTLSAVLILNNITGNVWSYFSIGGRSGGTTAQNGQQTNIYSPITLGGALDRIQITSVATTETFDAGSVNIFYE